MVLAHERVLPGQGHEAGRRLLAQLYFQQTGKPMPSLQVTDRGKPYFSDDPWHFSISHTKNHVFCVLSTEAVGMDAEETDRDIDLRLAAKILSATEYARYEQSADQRTALLKLWVLKEAHAKLSGQGLRGYPNKTDFDPDDPRVQIIENCYVAVLPSSSVERDDAMQEAALA